jgi:regulatory protein
VGELDPTATRALREATRLLSRRPRTVHELSNALCRRYDEPLVRTVVETLCSRGALDDRKTARDWLQYRAEKKPLGRAGLESHLLRRGFPREVIDTALGDYYRERQGGEEGDLRRSLADLVRRNPDRAEPAAVNRLASKLVRRGFPADAVWSLLWRQGLAEPETMD